MKTRTIFATLAIPATAVGLLAQENVTITRGIKTADEGIMLAQGAAGMISLSGGEPGNVRFMAQEFSFNGRPVTNAPYSADEKTESLQTLGDGNHINNTTTARVYRDSQGRTRREMTLPGFGGDQPHTIITINDPVSGANITLDPQTKTAHQMPGFTAAFKMRTDVETKMVEDKMKVEALSKMTEAKMKAEAGMTSSATFIRRAPAPNAKREDLPPDVMEGVTVVGSRETSTIEAGAMGNEKPITITSERWYSPELSIEVKSVHNDPRMGQTTHTLANINRAEPDPSLFQVPSDYTKDEGKMAVPAQRFEFHTAQ